MDLAVPWTYLCLAGCTQPPGTNATPATPLSNSAAPPHPCCVQLTWDADDDTRKRALTRKVTADELKEDDFKVRRAFIVLCRKAGVVISGQFWEVLTLQKGCRRL